MLFIISILANKPQTSYVAFGYALDTEQCLRPGLSFVATVKTVNRSVIIPCQSIKTLGALQFRNIQIQQ